MKPTELIEHPEGGRYKEVFRSPSKIIQSCGKEKSALTHIYFSLNRDEISRFHKVTSDEVWNLYQGEGIKLYIWDESVNPPECITLSTEENCFCHVVPAGMWQAAEPIGESVLLGCSVAPGFEFSDFELIEPDTDAARLLVSVAPNLQKFIFS